MGKTETYIETGGEQSSARFLVLDQFRQSIISGNPLPLEWLWESLKSGTVQPLNEFIADVLQAEKELAVAEAAAAEEREKPEVIGEDPVEDQGATATTDEAEPTSKTSKKKPAP